MDTTIDLAIVPVAGQGTRLLPSTKSQPKEMLPVGRKPAVQHVVEELAQSGMKRMLFITGPGKTSIENHFDVNPELVIYLRETGREELLEELEFERTVPEYYYTRQRRQLGLGHAVLCAESLVGDHPFVVALGDTILGLNEPSRIVSAMKKEFVVYMRMPWLPWLLFPLMKQVITVWYNSLTRRMRLCRSHIVKALVKNRLD